MIPEIDLEFSLVWDTLPALIARLEDTERLHYAISDMLGNEVKRHIRTHKESKNTGWWGMAANSVVNEATNDHAIVRIRQRGVALQLYGGTVEKKQGGPNLALPTNNVPVMFRKRLAPRDPAMIPLAFIPAKSKGGETVGYLVTGAEKTRKRDTKKGAKGTKYFTAAPKGQGDLMYVLRKRTHHKPHPDVIPSDEKITLTALLATKAYLDAAQQIA